MRFTPKTEEELVTILQPGIYNAEVIDAEEKVSKNGNPMIALKLKVHGPDEAVTVFDYLMESIPAKLRHCAEACGVLDRYDRGELDAQDFAGSAISVKLGIEVDKTGRYPDRNGVKDYIVGNSDARPAQVKLPAPMTNAQKILDAHPVKHPQAEAAMADVDLPF